MQTKNKKTKLERRAHKTLAVSAPLLSEPSPELRDNSEANIVTARDQVGGLVLEELLGAGGMGEVYKASKEGFENKLAVKILKSSLLKDESSRKRFEQEAQACSMLTSPHLVSVLGYGIASEGEPYIIMDYIEGESLAHFLAREKHLEQTVFTSVFTQVCDALIHSHGKQIIHRDLKPSNIMMTSLESGGFLIRVVDFGIARLLPSPETEEQKLTQTGELLGSPIYMGPEQCTGLPIDCRSDIYSLGCVMYEALTHKPPFLGDNVVKTILMHLNDAPMKFDDVLPKNTISPEIEAIVMKCLSKLPSERYQSADELKEALESVDVNTSDARKQILKNKQNKRRLRQYLHCHERKLLLAAATSLIGIISAFMFFSSEFDEDLYNKKVDAARLVEGQSRNAPGSRQLVDTAIDTWRECISLAEKLHKPALNMAALHRKLADCIAAFEGSTLALMQTQSDCEKEYNKAITVYRRRADSVSLLLDSLERLSSTMVTNFQLHPYTVESDVSLFAPIKQPTYDFTAYTHPDLDDADEKLKKHDYKSIISAYEKYFESPIFERDGRGREYYYYIIACRDLAIKDRTAPQSIRLFEHACAVDSKVDLRLAALYDLDTTIEANKMQARSFKDRMSLARKAASENDLRAAVFEATIALTIKNDESARVLLRHWRKQLEQKRITPGIERTLPLMEELLVLKRHVRVGNSNSTNYSLQKNIEDLTLGYLNNSDYAKAYDTYSSLAKLTGFNPEFNYYYRTLADIALRDGNIQGAIKNLKAEISAEHKNTKEDQRSYKSLGECYMNYALVLALSAQYDAAAQAIKDAKAAFEKSASDGDAFDSTSCGVGPGADLNLDL